MRQRTHRSQKGVPWEQAFCCLALRCFDDNRIRQQVRTLARGDNEVPCGADFLGMVASPHRLLQACEMNSVFR